MSISERRTAPRFSVALKGNVKTNKDNNFAIRVSNVSSSGLMFIIDTKEIPNLLPNESDKNNMGPVPVELDIELSERENNLIIQCGIVYVQRRTASSCTVGCRFEKFVDNSGKLFEEYLCGLNAQTLVLVSDKDA